MDPLRSLSISTVILWLLTFSHNISLPSGQANEESQADYFDRIVDKAISDAKEVGKAFKNCTDNWRVKVDQKCNLTARGEEVDNLREKTPVKRLSAVNIFKVIPLSDHKVYIEKECHSKSDCKNILGLKADVGRCTCLSRENCTKIVQNSHQNCTKEYEELGETGSITEKFFECIKNWRMNIGSNCDDAKIKLEESKFTEEIKTKFPGKSGSITAIRERPNEYMVATANLSTWKNLYSVTCVEDSTCSKNTSTCTCIPEFDCSPPQNPNATCEAEYNLIAEAWTTAQKNQISNQSFDWRKIHQSYVLGVFLALILAFRNSIGIMCQKYICI